MKNIKRKLASPAPSIFQHPCFFFFCLLAAAIQPSWLIIPNPLVGGLNFHCRPVDLFLPSTNILEATENSAIDPGVASKLLMLQSGYATISFLYKSTGSIPSSKSALRITGFLSEVGKMPCHSHLNKECYGCSESGLQIKGVRNGPYESSDS